LLESIKFELLTSLISKPLTVAHFISLHTLIFSLKELLLGVCLIDKLILVLKKAIKNRSPNPGLIVHSDKGPQMRSKEFRFFLKQHNFVPSYTSINHSCDDNAAQESFHSLLKKEKLYQIKLYSFQDVFNAIFEYIEGFYNPIRVHSSIGYLSPIDFEKKKFFLKTPSNYCLDYCQSPVNLLSIYSFYQLPLLFTL